MFEGETERDSRIPGFLGFHGGGSQVETCCGLGLDERVSHEGGARPAFTEQASRPTCRQSSRAWEAAGL